MANAPGVGALHPRRARVSPPGPARHGTINTRLSLFRNVILPVVGVGRSQGVQLFGKAVSGVGSEPVTHMQQRDRDLDQYSRCCPLTLVMCELQNAPNVSSLTSPSTSEAPRS